MIDNQLSVAGKSSWQAGNKGSMALSRHARWGVAFAGLNLATLVLSSTGIISTFDELWLDHDATENCIIARTSPMKLKS